MPERDIAGRFPIVILSAAALGLAVPSIAHGGASEWCATSGVLPSDASIPERDRFEIIDEESFASLNGDVLEIDDTVYALRVVFLKQDVEFLPDGEWAFRSTIRMISHDRDSLDFGASLGLLDGTRAAQFGVATGAIGFIDSPSTQWIPNASVAMDTTDAPHVYRVRKTGAGGDAVVEVFVDDDPTAVLTVPYENLNPTTATRVLLSATSIVGTARFDVHCFAFNPTGTNLVPCPGDVSDNGAVDFDDVLAILAAWGSPGGPADLDGSGLVDFDDLLIVLAAWGACP